jgi:DNA-binding PadR family transcriptional regulator
VYRALRRFRDSDLVTYELQPSSGGPDLKIYSLTETGSKVLKSFLERNITDIFYQPRNRKLIEEEMK